MVACPKEAPICAVYKSIYDEFSRHCVSQEEYNHIVNECEKYRDCSMVKYGKWKGAAYVQPLSNDLLFTLVIWKNFQ